MNTSETETKTNHAGANPYAGERVLFRCGPMGIGISSKRPGLFVKTYQNCTEVAVTDLRICGARKMPKLAFARHGKNVGKVVFSVPWGDVVHMERADYLLNVALWIQYCEAGACKGLGVEVGLFWRSSATRIEELIRTFAPSVSG